MSELSQRGRQHLIDRLGRETFDLLVVGGGITGAGIARDAALRGLSAALVERRDFACGTSSRSSKLIHGGVRYLQQGDVGLVMEAASERRAVRRIAPHLARPMHMLVPVSTRGGYAKLSVGLWTYDRMARVLDDERYRMLDRQQTLSAEPLLRRENLYGAGQYFEYVTDDARLVMANVKRAAALGATVLNYAPVTHLIEEGGRIAGAEVSDTIGDQTIPVRARLVINAAGPWVDSVRALSGNEQQRLHLTKGIHVTLRHERLPVSSIVVMTARDRRAVFVVPHGSVVYVGTTDTDYQGPLDDPVVSEEDVTYLLEAVERTFDVPGIRMEEVTGAWAGLRPLLHEEGKAPTELSRKDEIMVSPTGLISIAGGKLTTFRRMAQRAVDLAVEQLKESGRNLPAPRGSTDTDLLSGGATGDDVAGYVAKLGGKWPRVPGDIVRRLVDLYGSNADRIVEGIAADPERGHRLAPGSAVTRAEVEYVVREEMAATLGDVLERRTRLFLWDPDNGLPVALAVAAIMGRMLGWDATRIDSEVAQYHAHVLNVKGFVTATTIEPAQAAHA
jgi:glycerol-3-phosphate dehydrogenase